MAREIALILPYDKDKRILLQHRTSDAPTYPDYWGFFGGGIEEGESPLDAVKREAFEELELDLKKPVFLIKHSFNYNEKIKTLYVFCEQCNVKSSLKLHEGQGWGWFKIEETLPLKIVEHDKVILKAIKEKIFDKI